MREKVNKVADEILQPSDDFEGELIDLLMDTANKYYDRLSSVEQQWFEETYNHFAKFYPNFESLDYNDLMINEMLSAATDFELSHNQRVDKFWEMIDYVKNK